MGRSFLVALAVMAGGCASVYRSAGVSPDAAVLLLHARAVNAPLATLRGLGTLSIGGAGKHFQARVAWICQPPDRFRITVLGALGRPAASLASDGQQVRFLSHDSGEFRQWQRGSVFSPALLPIAIAPEDIADVLSGKIPVRTHDAAVVTMSDDAARRTVVLKQWGRIVQTIDFPGDETLPDGFAVYSDHRARDYGVSYADFQEVAGYRLPVRTDIDGRDGSRVSMRADRYWPDVSADPQVFILAPR